MKYNGVAISGKAGAGKDMFGEEVRNALAERGIWSVRRGFADAPKADVFRIWGLAKSDFGGREKLIEYADGNRQEDPDVWVKRFTHDLGSLSPYGVIPTICDLRYMNEYEWVKKAGMLMVRVDALRQDRLAALAQRGEDPAFVDSEHESEVALDDEAFDVRLWNPHSHASHVLRAYALQVADLLDGTVERVAA